MPRLQFHHTAPSWIRCRRYCLAVQNHDGIRNARPALSNLCKSTSTETTPIKRLEIQYVGNNKTTPPALRHSETVSLERVVSKKCLFAMHTSRLLRSVEATVRPSLSRSINDAAPILQRNRSTFGSRLKILRV